ncbi:MAG: IS1634 family transposase [Actinomycetota bacterium]|nr:IS1634 family transposase [Actinomycetota bacterium]
MYVRTKTTEGRTYLQIVESIWREGKSHQRVVATLGRIDKLQAKGDIDKVILALSRYSEKVKVTEEYREGKLEAKKVSRVGPDLVAGRLWNELGLGEVIGGLLEGRKHSFSVERAIYLSTLSRLFFPGSDRKAKRITRDYQVVGAEGIELHHLYRAMAWLGENREVIEEKLFDRNRNLFTSLSVVFFDTTSIYFEGEGGKELGARGYSKDRRPDENQMVVGVVTDQDGRPISCPMWPGNTTDARTIVPVARGLQKRFGVGDVVIVADRGMVGKKNAEALAHLGFTYILGVKMRLEKKAMREVLSHSGRFTEVESNLKVKEVIHNGKRYVVCLNPEEAKKDAASREAIVSQLKEKLKKGTGQLVGNSGYRRFLKVTKESVILDEEKIKTDEKFDGKWVLITNSDLPTDEISTRYKELWMVERVFREAKDTLETRHVFHQKDTSIMGHVFISFLALLLMHELKRRIDFPAEWDEIRADLDALYEVEVQSDGSTYFLRSPLEGICGKVLKSVGVAIPPTARKR